MPRTLVYPVMLAVLGAQALPAALSAQTAPPPAAQHPSPMVDFTRAHERLRQRELAGTLHSFPGPAGRAVEVWIPDRQSSNTPLDLVIHFHGASWLPIQAVAEGDRARVAAVVNLGAGSGAYHRAFAEPTAFDSLLAGIARVIPAHRAVRLGDVVLSGFSAGHGAIRAILRAPQHMARVHGVLLLDGMHTSYVPEGRVLADSGTLDTTNLSAFAQFARAAMRGEKRFVITHSEIFPGSYASTTETADWLLQALSLRRRPVLAWGPRGMQQLSTVREGQFEVLGFAGNTAPDHIDHLHAMPELLRRLLGERATTASDSSATPSPSAP